MGTAARLEGEEEGSERERLRRGSRRVGPALRNAWTRGAWSSSPTFRSAQP